MLMKRIKTEKPQRYAEASVIGWRRPTFPQLRAVSSALRGLTSLFGMGRGGPPRYSHRMFLWMSWHRTEEWHSQLSGRASSRAAFYVYLIKVRQSFRAISTARLNTSLRLHLQPINVVVSHDPYRKSHLEVGFALRCFQRLSRPNAATLRCGWRHNRYTGGSSIPVLSY